MKKKKCRPEWKLITEYDVTSYKCGLVAGDRVRVRKDIVVRDWRGKPTGKVHRAGEVWIVLRGSSDDPGVVWLRQPDGRSHTWDDKPEIWNWFERVSGHEDRHGT